MSVFSEILQELKCNDVEIDERIRRYEENIRQEKELFIQNTTPKNYWDARKETLDKRILNFMSSEKTFCWICGEYGRGKTYSLYAIRNSFIMCGNIYFEIKMEGELNYDVDFKRINAIDNMAISEGKMKFLADFYFNLIDWCWKNKKKLYLTSTKKYDEWLTFFSKYNAESAEAIASRFSNSLEVIELLGNDRRKQK